MKSNRNVWSILLALASACGLVTTTVMAVKATPKALECIKSDSRTAHDGDPYGYTKKEAIDSAWKYYAPSTVAGLITIACIAGLGKAAIGVQLSIPGAYMFINEARKKIIDEHERAERAVPAANNDMVQENQTLFYDHVGGRYFNSTLYTVRNAEYNLNRQFGLEGEVEINDFYDLLGLSHIEALNDHGWSIGGGLEYDQNLWIDFDHVMVTTDDGMQCCIISPKKDPVLNYK